MVRYLKLKILLVCLRWGWQKIKKISLSVCKFHVCVGSRGCSRECAWRGRRDNVGKTVRGTGKFGNEKSRLAGA